MSQQSRQLAAILFTDIVGYTSMMQHDEQAAVAVNRHYISVLKQTVYAHHGNVLNDYGDGSLCSFPSVTDALQCAVEMQQQLQTEPKVPLRIGLHIGEIFFDDGKVMGDSVNIASRIQSLGQGNTILFSKEVFDKLKNKSGYKSISLGKFDFKNVDEPMEVFALANEGLVVPKKEEMSGKLKEIKARSTLKKLLVISSALILLAIGIFFVIKSLKADKGFTGKDRSIVVLPFDNYSNDPEQENFINGITEEITTQLAKIADLKVIGRNSASLYKKSKKPLDQIAEALGVSAYLEGSVQKIEGKVRITAQLINANTQQHIWADRYDRDLKDIFSMQSEVAQDIAERLHASLTKDERNRINKKPTDNLEAYKYYIKGRTFWNARGKQNFDSAEANFKKAVAIDPQFALAYAGIADCYIYNYKGMLQLEAIPIARAYANQALLIDSSLSEGLTTLGFIQHNFEYKWDESKRTLEKAIAIQPNNSTAHLYLGNLLQYTGETKRGLGEAEKAVELDPLSFGGNWVLGRNYYLAKKYDDAIKQLEKAKVLAPPNNNVAIWSLGLVYLQRNMHRKALEEYEKIPNTATDRIDNIQIMKCYAYAVSGDTAKAKEILRTAMREDPLASPYRIAQVYVALGDYNEALNQLDKAYNNRDLHMFWIKVDPSFDAVRNEQWFKNLLKKMNLH